MYKFLVESLNVIVQTYKEMEQEWLFKAKIFRPICFNFSAKSILHPQNIRPISDYIDHKYECIIDQELADAGAYAPGKRWVFAHQVAALLRKMTPWPTSWKCGVKLKIRLRQLVCIYFKNNQTEF